MNEYESINNSPAFFQQTGELNQTTTLKFTTLGINAVSIIVEAFDINDNHVNFSNQQYSISVSNDDQKYTKLFDINLGYESIISNSLSEGFSAALMYRHVKISVPNLGEGVKCKISCSCR